jgi:hypothetical protein
MDNLELKQVPVSRTGILIRKPVAEVFPKRTNEDSGKFD